MNKNESLLQEIDLGLRANNMCSETSFNEKNCVCDNSVGYVPCPYCAVHYALQRCRKFVEESTTEKENMINTIKKYQYAEDGTCPCCGLWEMKGHRENCEIGKLVKETPPVIFSEPTDEDEIMFEQAIKCFDAINLKHKDEVNVQGEMVCPVCKKGTLFYFIAHNGHCHGECKNGCGIMFGE